MFRVDDLIGNYHVADFDTGPAESSRDPSKDNESRIPGAQDVLDDYCCINSTR